MATKMKKRDAERREFDKINRSALRWHWNGWRYVLRIRR